jgi:hypothetical protein
MRLTCVSHDHFPQPRHLYGITLKRSRCTFMALTRS